MSEINSIIRKFERLVFRGVPEKPEPNFERTLNADADDRLTNRSQLKPSRSEINDNEATLIANIKYYPEIGEIKIEKIITTE
jgi:hypothetical protein